MAKGNKKAGISIAVFIDALGWELLKTEEFLPDLLPCREPIETIFGYSATCDPTILTGLLPRDHGHFSFFAYDPERSPFRRNLFLLLMRLVPKMLASRHRVRNVVSRILRRQLAYSGYFNIYNMPFTLLPFFDYTEKRDLYQPDGINSGSPTIMDYAREKGIDFFLSDWRASEETNLAALKEAIASPERDCTFAYLYMAAMDATLHQYGKPHPEVSAKMRWYDARLRELISTAEEEYEEVRIFLFSDHGMTNITGTCDLIPVIEATGLKFGTDYAAVYDSTMARFWFIDEQSEAPIRRALETAEGGRILTDEELTLWGVDFPDKRYGDLFFLLDPGILLVPSHMGERPLAGMHGYEPGDPDSTASFMTNVELDASPPRLDSLYTLMREEIDRWNP